jgi:hypothetical protein
MLTKKAGVVGLAMTQARKHGPRLAKRAVEYQRTRKR